MNRKTRSILTALSVIIVVWLLAWVGYVIAQNSKMTADKVRQYARSVDLKGLSAVDRAEALRKLEEKINALSIEERRKWRMESEWKKWFENMTENEKGQFIEATMPTGFKQMLNVFEEMPEQKRKKVIDDAMKRLKEAHQMATDQEPGQDTSMYGTNGAPALSPELEKKAQTIGLRLFYTESSAETKAELAPFLEELQRQMQNGRGFH
ncbi:MAG: hypothetical protein JWR26_176 [Pedosphaera sp.]|nr:hypothetical protein [Pedosphaera sp.]